MTLPATRSELLCFVRNKCTVMTVDHLVDLCSDFFTADEVEEARVELMKYAAQRLPKHKTADRKRRTMTDIVKMCLDPTTNLPDFYAVDLCRLPPVGVEHVDISALLVEVASLRAEVRAMASIKDDLMKIRQDIEIVRIDSASSHSTSNPVQTAPASATSSAASTPVHLASSTTSLASAPAVTPARPIVQGPSAASIVANAVRSGALEKNNRRAKLVTGKAVNQKLRTVAAKKEVHLFVSRLNPDTSTVDVTECVTECLVLHSGTLASQCKVTCIKLDTKFDTYASFHVSVNVSSDNLHSVFNVLLSEEAWPQGVLVRKYFVKK